MSEQGELILVLGGARSGKSAFAEKIAGRTEKPVLYVATAQALDDEMRQRIEQHRRLRPAGWRTLEAVQRVGEAIRRTVRADEIVLVDCLTLLVSNAVLREGEGATLAQARPHVEAEVEALLQAARNHTQTMIVVANEVGMGVVPPYDLGRVYQDLLGWANQRLASEADRVYLMVAGLPIEIKRLATEDHGDVVSPFV